MDSFFFFNDTATTEIYTLSLHDALPILDLPQTAQAKPLFGEVVGQCQRTGVAEHAPDLVVQPGSQLPASGCGQQRSEEHTSELQSRQYLVCRLLLEKKNALQHASFVSSC